MPTGGAASGRVCACSLRSRLVTSSGVNCSSSPMDPPGVESGWYGLGSREWDGSLAFETRVNYTCGLTGHFVSPLGDHYSQASSKCTWDKTWLPASLDPCQGRSTPSTHSFLTRPCPATRCQFLVLPPESSGLVLEHQDDFEIGGCSVKEINSYTSSLFRCQKLQDNNSGRNCFSWS